MLRESISQMKNGKDARPSGVVSDMLKAAGEPGVDMITSLVNQSTVERVIPAEWELTTIVNCFKGKDNSLKRENYKRLKLTDLSLKIAEKIIEKVIRQKVDTDDMQFGFTPGCQITHIIFIWRQSQEEY